MENKEVAKKEEKKFLKLEVSFARRSFTKEDTGEEVFYITGETEYDGEPMKFKLHPEFSKLFAYMMKIHGYPVVPYADEDKEVK